MNEYLAINIGGYFYMNSLYALIAAWLDASLRSCYGVRLNRSARQYSISNTITLGIQCRSDFPRKVTIFSTASALFIIWSKIDIDAEIMHWEIRLKHGNVI